MSAQNIHVIVGLNAIHLIYTKGKMDMRLASGKGLMFVKWANELMMISLLNVKK